MLRNDTVDKLYFLSFFISVVFGLFHFYIQKSEILGLYIFTIIAIPLLLLPMLAIKIFKANGDQRFINRLKTSSLVIFYVNSAGTLLLYKYYEYDQLAHFITFVMLTLIFVISLKKIAGESFKIITPLIFLVMFIGGAAFELVQFSIDQIFNSTLFYDATQPISMDVLTDIIADSAGAIAGLVIFKLKNKKPMVKAI